MHAPLIAPNGTRIGGITVSSIIARNKITGVTFGECDIQPEIGERIHGISFACSNAATEGKGDFMPLL